MSSIQTHNVHIVKSSNGYILTCDLCIFSALYNEKGFSIINMGDGNARHRFVGQSGNGQFLDLPVNIQAIISSILNNIGFT